MPFSVVVFANLSEDCICISGTPLNTAGTLNWNRFAYHSDQMR